MPDSFFQSILKSEITPTVFLCCAAASLVLGLFLAFTHIYKNHSSKSFAMTVALMPLIVQVIIMLVNGNLGTGVAVAGAFSLVRFRSLPGTAREILSIFMAMAVGLATGTGYIGIAVVFTVLLCALSIIYTLTRFAESDPLERELKIIIPENLNYTDVFDDLFGEYTSFHRLKRVKTANMGSLYNLTYTVRLKNPAEEKQFIDKIRCRNGNLDISCNYSATVTEEL